MEIRPEDVRIKVDLKNSLPRTLIAQRVEEFGFCLLRPSRDSENALLEVASYFGRIQNHERSKPNGIVDVTSDPRLQKQKSAKFKGLGTAKFGPHTDGAFLNAIYSDHDGRLRHISPPAYLILQCVKQAAVGGESMLIDAQDALKIMKERHPADYALLCEPLFHFVREADQRLFPIEAPVFKVLANGNNSIRFREEYIFNLGIPSHPRRLQAALDNLYNDCLMSPQCQRKIRLEDGDILVIDNFRMLHGRSPFKVVKGRHRHLRRVWIVDEDHLIRLNGDNTWEVDFEGGGKQEFLARALPAGHSVVTDYRIHQNPVESSKLIHPRLGIKT